MTTCLLWLAPPWGLADETRWWSFQPLEAPAVPVMEDADPSLVRNPVDAFVLARLRTKGLSPLPEADRRTLLRRIYFDLTGLPPTPGEVEAFVRNPDPLAYEKVVDRLLDSPRYGERWARHWLDVVHYGDTHGYDKDKPRPNAWPYRDYVIRAFNDDKPYGRFVQEQVAGDVLYPETADGIVALGFIAAGPWDFIGHAEVPETKVDGQIARHLDRDDMVANTINTFSSLTVHCARCHDHKFDPIDQVDYYRLQAVFAALDRADRPYDNDPAVTRRRLQLQQKERAWMESLEAIEATVRRLGGEPLAGLTADLEALKQSEGEGRRPEYGYHSAIEPAADVETWVQVDLGKTVALRDVVLIGCNDDFNGIGPGFGFPPRYKVEISDDAGFETGVHLALDRTDVDAPNPGVTPRIIEMRGAAGRYVRVTATRLAPRQNDYILALAELEAHDTEGTNVARGAKVDSPDSIEAPVRWARANLVDGIHPANEGAEAKVTRARLEEERRALLNRVMDSATRKEQDAAERALAEVRKALGSLPQPGMVYAGTIHHGTGAFRGTGPDQGRPRTIHVLYRGDVGNRGPEVDPGALKALPGLKASFGASNELDDGQRRAALARWLSDPDNPLTWRSIVNRVWLYHFGRGMVDSPNDFGRMGLAPSHPELLDWLAATFRDGGQSIKQLNRMIVTSAAYRRASSGSNITTQLALNVDANNALLWRMNRRRLEAEAIRDSVLAVSGKLNLTMYGPGFQDFIVDKPEHSPHYEYHLHDPNDPGSHRRSVYRFLVRSQQQPFMKTLDCADPSMLVDKRNESLSPLQALALLNNPFMLAMSRAFAARLEMETSVLEDKMERAVWLTLNRAPTDGERAMLTAYAREHGVANACRVIFNLNEFSFVD